MKKTTKREFVVQKQAGDNKDTWEDIKTRGITSTVDGIKYLRDEIKEGGTYRVNSVRATRVVTPVLGNILVDPDEKKE